MWVGVIVDVFVGGTVSVGDGVFVTVGISVLVGVRVAVEEGVIVGVLVGVYVFVGVLVLVGGGNVTDDAGRLMLQAGSLNETEIPKLFTPRFNGGFENTPLNPPPQSMDIVFVVFAARSIPKLVGELQSFEISP